MASSKNATKYGFFMEAAYLRPGGEPGAAQSEEAAQGGEEQAAADRDHGLNLKVTAGRSGKVRQRRSPRTRVDLSEARGWRARSSAICN